MSDHSARTEELIAAAAASDLTAQEQIEFDALRADDSSIDATIQELTDVLPGLTAAVAHWQEAEPPARLADAIKGLPLTQEPAQDASGPQASDPDDPPREDPDRQDSAPAVPLASAAEADGVVVEPTASESHAAGPRTTGAETTTPGSATADIAGRRRSRKRSPRRRGAFALVAAGCIVAGVGGTLAVQYIVESPPDGPPGTFGAVEEIAFAVDPGGVAVDGSLIAHTWGTETVLEIEGLQPGESFSVVLVAEDGEEFISGTFFGSEVLIECRMNAAIMRDQVDSVEITADDGDLIARAEVPEAIDPEAEYPQAEP